MLVHPLNCGVRCKASASTRGAFLELSRRSWSKGEKCVGYALKRISNKNDLRKNNRWMKQNHDYRSKSQPMARLSQRQMCSIRRASTELYRYELKYIEWLVKKRSILEYETLSAKVIIKHVTISNILGFCSCWIGVDSIDTIDCVRIDIESAAIGLEV